MYMCVCVCAYCDFLYTRDTRTHTYMYKHIHHACIHKVIMTLEAIAAWKKEQDDSGDDPDDNVGVIYCGDFNSTPFSDIYDFILSGEIALGTNKDPALLSGQVICLCVCMCVCVCGNMPVVIHLICLCLCVFACVCFGGYFNKTPFIRRDGSWRGQTLCTAVW
jgi:hypothetical protein